MRLSRIALLSMLLALLAACASTPTQDQQAASEPVEITAPASVDEALAQLATSSGQRRNELAIGWATDYLQQGRVDAATQMLRRVGEPQPQGELLVRWTLVQVPLMLNDGDTAGALALLQSAELHNAESQLTRANLRGRLALLRADTLTLNDELLASLRERVKANALLNDEQQKYNQGMIWTQLMLLPRTSLEEARTTSGDSSLDGWLELAMIYRDPSADIDTQMRNIDGWQQRWPDHAASRSTPEMISGLKKAVRNRPDTVAVLLPMTGSLAPAARAIRDGIMSSYYGALSQGHPVPHMLFLDTASADIGTLYNQATSAGARLIIGPLSKDQVAALAAQPSLPVPTLTLNYADAEQSTGQLYQFGLAPEDEARQAAQQASLEGMQLAAVLYPNGAWGERVAQAFISEFTRLGGIVTTSQSYGEDPTGSTRNLLDLGQSQGRARDIQRYTSLKVEFEPRRRQDIDVVFMIANPDQARQLKPALNFHYASNLPVLAISQIYTGTPEPTRDADLNGIRFVDMPWLLDDSSDLHRLAYQVWPQGHGRYERLFALGVDAYRLHARLPLLQSMPDSFLPGVTGQLSLDSQQRLVRKLQWAWFTGGKPQRVPVVAGNTGQRRQSGASIVAPAAGE